MSSEGKAYLITDAPGRKAACIHCSCWQCCIWLLAFPYLLSVTLLMDPWWKQPGNEMRKAVHDEVVRALGRGQWDQVKEKYLDNNWWNSLLMIGTSQGLPFAKEDGREKNEKYEMGSQTKILTALTIYKVMEANPQLLSPETLVSEYAPGWPTTGFGGKVRLKHLLAMTTGLVADVFKPGCVGTLEPKGDEEAEEKWFRCMTEISHYEFRYEPGTVFHYGPWHLFVAGGVVLRALNQPLTKTSWVNLMQENLYTPCGIALRPDFPEYPTLPDLNHGMSVSADQWQLITHKLMFDNLLPANLKRDFMKDHSADVDKVWGDSPTYEMWPYREMRAEQALSGGWHYAQGHWILCDALATKDAQDEYHKGERFTWEQQNDQCGFVNGIVNSGPQHHSEVQAQHSVHHSVGEHGSFIWMDSKNEYYGIYVQYYNWPYWLFAGTFLLALASGCCCCVSLCMGCFINSRQKKEDQY